MVVEAHNPGWLNALYYPMLVVTAGMVCTPRFRSPWKVQGLSHESFLGYPKERKTLHDFSLYAYFSFLFYLFNCVLSVKLSCCIGGAFDIFQLKTVWSVWCGTAQRQRLSKEDDRFLFGRCVRVISEALLCAHLNTGRMKKSYLQSLNDNEPYLCSHSKC